MNVKLQRILRGVGVMILLYVAGMAVVYGFSILDIPTLIGFPVFMLGILVASLELDVGLWGALRGVAYLGSYDFFFTRPVFHLKVLSRTDIVALAILLAVALIMSSLTQRMKNQVKSAERNALMADRLNTISTGLMHSVTPEGACSMPERR